MTPANGGVHTPVQMQKLVFLLDRKLATELGGPHFDFAAYDYGPFDRAVYDVLRELEQQGLVETLFVNGPRWKKYRTTPQGQRVGEELLQSIGNHAAEAIKRLSAFVRSLSFAELVSSIYNAYPEMKVNSVFRA